MEEKVIRLSQYGGCWRADVEEETWLVNVGSGNTPWEASAEACAKLGEGYRVLWEKLPWTETRIALGIVMGVAEVFGATASAQRAIESAWYGQWLPSAASTAERLLRQAVERRCDASAQQALYWLTRVASYASGYSSSAKLAELATRRGMACGRRGIRFARRALRQLAAANARRYGSS